MIVSVNRMERHPHGVFGMMTFSGIGTYFHSLEDDWLNNLRNVSCIPSGQYLLRRTIYYKHGYETFEITGVPNRSRILIHPGNTEEDLQGCIAIGLRRGKLLVPKDEDTGELNVLKEAVVESQLAFYRFMQVMTGLEEAPIYVTWADGLP
jgi:hypothetical protein